MDMRDGRLVFSECKSGGAKTCTLWAGGHTSCLQACIATAFILLTFLGTGTQGKTRSFQASTGVSALFSTSSNRAALIREHGRHWKMALKQIILRLLHDPLTTRCSEKVFLNERMMSDQGDHGAHHCQNADHQGAPSPGSKSPEAPKLSKVLLSLSRLQNTTPTPIPHRQPWPTDPNNPPALRPNANPPLSKPDTWSSTMPFLPSSGALFWEECC